MVSFLLLDIEPAWLEANAIVRDIVYMYNLQNSQVPEEPSWLSHVARWKKVKQCPKKPTKIQVIAN